MPFMMPAQHRWLMSEGDMDGKSGRSNVSTNSSDILHNIDAMRLKMRLMQETRKQLSFEEYLEVRP